MKNEHCWYCSPLGRDNPDKEKDIIGTLKMDVENEDPGLFAGEDERLKFRDKKLKRESELKASSGYIGHEVVTPQQVLEHLERYSGLVLGKTKIGGYVWEFRRGAESLSSYSGYYESSGDWVEGSSTYKNITLKGRRGNVFEIYTCEAEEYDTERITLYEYEKGLVLLETSLPGVRHYGSEVNSFFIMGKTVKDFLLYFFKRMDADAKGTT